MDKAKSKLIVALDVDTFESASALIDRLGDSINIYKVGSQLFTACGPAIVSDLLKADKKVFLDLKFHDIPNTVANAVSSAIGLSAGGQSIFMCTLHITGGKEMLSRAVRAATEIAQNIGVTRPLLAGITVLTSDEKKDNIHNLVLKRARLAKEAGLDGVVTSSQECAAVREDCGDDFIIVTPGIRPEGTQAQDQKRVATPDIAIKSGSNYLVVGRPIVKADDPLIAAKAILKEITAAQA